MATRRTKISTNTEKQVLTKCRRRCCICFGLDRDTQLKSGQIAHLDGERNNNDIDNLAFLCLHHHDQYDSQTSQSKGLTIHEVRDYRTELEEAIASAWKEPVKFGEISFEINDHITGHYVRDGEYNNAELDVVYLGNDVIKVNGFAIWRNPIVDSPHLGDLDFASIIFNSQANFTDNNGEKVYELKLTFFQNGLIAEEENVWGYYGANVNFAGEYRKV